MPCRPSRFFNWSSTSSRLAPNVKPYDDRMRDVACQVPELGQGDAHLEQPDKKCQQNGGLQAVFGRNDCHRAEHGNRNDVGGPVNELTRRVENRADGGHDDGRVESIFRRNPCDQRIGHGLGNRNGGHGEAGNEISPQVADSGSCAASQSQECSGTGRTRPRQCLLVRSSRYAPVCVICLVSYFTGKLSCRRRAIPWNSMTVRKSTGSECTRHLPW